MNMRQLIAVLPFDDRDRAALDGALSTRGKNADDIRETPPSATKDPHAYAAWMALVGNLAPQRLSISGLMFLDSDAKDAFDRMDRVATAFRTALNAYSRPYRWNLWAHTYDVDAARARIDDVLPEVVERYRSMGS